MVGICFGHLLGGAFTEVCTPETRGMDQSVCDETKTNVATETTTLNYTLVNGPDSIRSTLTKLADEGRIRPPTLWPRAVFVSARLGDRRRVM